MPLTIKIFKPLFTTFKNKTITMKQKTFFAYKDNETGIIYKHNKSNGKKIWAEVYFTNNNPYVCIGQKKQWNVKEVWGEAWKQRYERLNLPLTQS